MEYNIQLHFALKGQPYASIGQQLMKHEPGNAVRNPVYKNREMIL